MNYQGIQAETSATKAEIRNSRITKCREGIIIFSQGIIENCEITGNSEGVRSAANGWNQSVLIKDTTKED